MLRPLMRPLLSPLLRAPLRAGVGRVAAATFNFLTETADPRITYSGGAGGTRTNSAGVIVAATTPRIDYDPVTLAVKGLLVEEQRTNQLLNSDLAGTNLSTQIITVTAAPQTLSFYGTGTVTLSGASIAGPLIGSGAYPTRSTLTFTPTAGALTLTVVGTVQFAQCELGSFATSFIPTAGTAVTRTADSAAVLGANFSSWYNQTEGTLVVEGQTVSFAAGAIASIDDGSSSNTINIVQQASGNNCVFAITVATVGQLAGGAVVNTTLPIKGAIAYKANDTAWSANGLSVVMDASVSLPVVDRLKIGGRGVGQPLNGHVRSIRFFRTRLPNAQLQALST